MTEGQPYEDSHPHETPEQPNDNAPDGEWADRRLRAVLAVTDVALVGLPLDDLLPALLDRLRDALQVDNAVILLLDERGETLRVRAARGLEEEVAPSVRAPLGKGFAGRVASGRKPWVVNDITSIQVANPFLQKRLRSVVGVPLSVDGRVIGVLHVGMATPYHFGEDDVAVLELVAERAARAIETTRLRETERRLQGEVIENERHFRATFEQAAVGMAEVGLDGRWLRVNDRLCQIVGYARDELLARTFQDITHPADLTSDLALLRQLLDGEVPTYTMEKRCLRGNGSLIWVNLTVSLVRDAAGSPLYFITVVEDISARKAAEQALRDLNVTLERRVALRTAQLQGAYDELEAFAYSVSHDLRAPLRAMEGFAQALDEDYAEALDETARMYTERIVTAAARMDQLIQDLLAYSRLTREEVTPRAVDLDVIVAEALESLARDIQRRDARVTVERPLPRVMGNRVMLRQVISNLVGNAITYVAPDRAPRVRIYATTHPPGKSAASGDRPTVRLWVEDNGIGIAPEHQERIFRVFERLHSVEEYPGTGIGLAIVRKGAERMGGSAGVQSAPGSGSRFWIELPRALARPANE